MHYRGCIRLALLRRAVVLAAALAAFGAAPALAWDHGGRDDRDAVYTQTNDPSGNSVVVFTRHDDGSLTQRAVVPTGGRGTPAQPPFGFPIVDSQDAVHRSDDGRLLFVVNSGDNTISSFRITGHGLKLADVEPSGGVLPVSLTSSGNELYVLNSLSGNIYGLRVSHDGKLRGIHGSSQNVSAPGPNAIPADIGFAPGGRVLAVSERCYDLSAVAPPINGCPGGNTKGIIDTFAVDWRGVAGPAQPHPSSDFGPFGFAFQGSRHLEVTNTGNVGSPFGPTNPGNPALFLGTLSSYDVGGSGSVSPDETISTGGRGACWVVITGDGRHMFATNSLSTFPPGSGSGAVARFALSSHGTPTLLGTTDVTPSSPAGAAFATDVALSGDSRFLYVLVPTLGMLPAPANNNVSHIDVYRVSSNGNLTHIQSTPATLPAGVSGLGAS